jgi:hypothetical protein
MATGIGSLPFTNPQEALTLILAELSTCPHWPQLPQRGRQEHFVHQFLQPLVACGILVSENDRWFFDLSRDTSAESLTAFYSSCMAAEEGDADALRCFLPGPEAAAGLHAFLAGLKTDERLQKADFVKGQIAGPLTVALELKDEQGRPAYYHGDLRDIVIRTLALNARAQAAALSALGPAPIVFIDDPAIGALGSRLHLALNRETILEDLNFIITAIQSEKGLAGVHACEAVDWSVLTDSMVDIISVDTYRFGSSLIPYGRQLREFLMRGKTIAWGIVPTLDDVDRQSATSLLQRLFDLWKELFGQQPAGDLVLGQSIITPACGAGLLSCGQTEQIYRLAADISRRIGELLK